MKELYHFCNNVIVLFGYTFLLFILLCLSLTSTTVPAITLLLSLLWCIGIAIDACILFRERERLDYGTLD